MSPSSSYLSRYVLFHYITKYRSPITPYKPKLTWFGLLPFRSPLLRESIALSPPTPT